MLRDELRAALTGWPIGYGYYSATIGTDEAGELADYLIESSIAAALAETARPGQELRARVADIAEDLEIHSEEVGRGEGDLNELDLERYAAALRAALEDPR